MYNCNVRTKMVQFEVKGSITRFNPVKSAKKKV